MTNQREKLTPRALMRYAFRGALLAAAAGIGVAVYHSDPETLEHLGDFPWPLTALMFGLIVLAWLCNGFRVFILSRSLGYRLSYRQSLTISMSTEFGIAATPAGMGGAAIRLTLLRKAGVPLAHGATMFTIDLALDTLYFALLFPFAVASLLGNPKIRALFQSADPARLALIGALTAGGLALGIAACRRGWWRHAASPLLRSGFGRQRRAGARLRLLKWRAVHEFRLFKQGWAMLFQLRRGWVLLSFLAASVQWTCRYGVLPLLLFALDKPNDPVLLFLLQGLLFTASLLFVMPGGGGGVELTAALVLRQIIQPSLTGVVVLMWRFFTYHLYLLGGGAAFFIACARHRSLFPAPSAGEPEAVGLEWENEEAPA